MPINMEEYQAWAKTVDAPSIREFLTYKTRSLAGKQNAEKRWEEDNATVIFVSTS